MLLIPSYYKHLNFRIDITQQDSLPFKWWITQKPFTTQEYVLFRPPLDKYTKNANFYLKKIACKPTQKLETKGNIYFCNGKQITIAQPYDMDGVPLYHLDFNFIIPKDMYFVIGTHKYSYDSKYFGLITKRQIIRGAIPLVEYFNGGLI
jgi:type IV secretory pathway protease TraF